MDISYEGMSAKEAVALVEAVCSAKSGGTQPTDVQQLQAKIAALIPGIVTSFTLCDEKQFIALTNELRQLSAVQ